MLFVLYKKLLFYENPRSNSFSISLFVLHIQRGYEFTHAYIRYKKNEYQYHLIDLFKFSASFMQVQEQLFGRGELSPLENFQNLYIYY